jgi:hypothetical protein
MCCTAIADNFTFFDLEIRFNHDAGKEIDLIDVDAIGAGPVTRAALYA